MYNHQTYLTYRDSSSGVFAHQSILGQKVISQGHKVQKHIEAAGMSYALY